MGCQNSNHYSSWVSCLKGKHSSIVLSLQPSHKKDIKLSFYLPLYHTLKNYFWPFYINIYIYWVLLNYSNQVNSNYIRTRFIFCNKGWFFFLWIKIHYVLLGSTSLFPYLEHCQIKGKGKQNQNNAHSEFKIFLFNIALKYISLIWASHRPRPIKIIK